MAQQQAVQSIEWREDHARIIDQTYLPKRTVYSDIRDVGRMWEAIKKLRVRGAPAIGIAAAYGLYLGVRDLPESRYESFWIEVKRIADYLSGARPTAVNLNWALERIKNEVRAHKDDPIAELKERVLKTAKVIHDEDRRICKLIGEHGAELIEKGDQILTHCNTGSLATSQYGTALSAVYHAHDEGKEIHVWVDETRPLLQGARLTAWELQNAEIPYQIVIDSAAGYLMKSGKVDKVIVGADRVASNGDTANKIGTYALAVLAKENEIPFYVALPLSTIDREIATGEEIPIEERNGDEVLTIGDSDLTPKKADAYNPAFDVTPHEYITGFITEKGVIEPDFGTAFEKLFED